MDVTITISSEYGYVLLIICSSWFLTNWLEARTLQARRRYEVPYPRMYTEPINHVFNCVQRAHQNTLEGYPSFLALLFLGGLAFPRISAAAGLIFLAGRVVYALGYYSGDPEKRQRGAFGYIGLLTLLINTVILGLRLLGIVSV